MNVIRSLPCNIDYILGVLMVACGAYSLYSSIWITWQLFELLNIETLFYILSTFVPNFWIIGMGILMIFLPRKNIRRTIWLSAFILSGYCLLYAITRLYATNGYVGYSAYDFLYFSLGIIDLGCAVAFFVNGLFFKYHKSNYIFAITIATIVLFVSGYIEVTRIIRMFGWEMSQSIIATTVPMMILCIVFALVFTSREVSWYTSARGILNAVGRVHSTEDTSAGFTVSRGFLAVLGAPHGDFSSRIWCGRYRAVIEVREKDGGRDVLITRDGNGSLAGAVRIVDAIIVPQGDVDTCDKLMIYGHKGLAVRLDVDEPLKGAAWGKKRSAAFGIVHPGSAKLTRADALRILREEHAEVPCRGRGGPASVRVDRDGSAVTLTFAYRDGRSAEVRATFMSKDDTDATFERLFAFLPDGRFVLIKVKDTLSEKSAKYREERMRLMELNG